MILKAQALRDLTLAFFCHVLVYFGNLIFASRCYDTMIRVGSSATPSLKDGSLWRQIHRSRTSLEDDNRRWFQVDSINLKSSSVTGQQFRLTQGRIFIETSGQLTANSEDDWNTSCDSPSDKPVARGTRQPSQPSTPSFKGAFKRRYKRF
jgi:hypothetical protein